MTVAGHSLYGTQRKVRHAVFLPPPGHGATRKLVASTVRQGLHIALKCNVTRAGLFLWPPQPTVTDNSELIIFKSPPLRLRA